MEASTYMGKDKRKKMASVEDFVQKQRFEINRKTQAINKHITEVKKNLIVFIGYFLKLL